MKHVLLASAIIFGGTASAMAGTLAPAPQEPPVYAPAPAPALPLAYDWRGGYAGVGLSLGRTDHGADEFPEFWDDGSGGGIGVLGGYNWQSGNTVYGLEGHLSGHRMRGEANGARTDLEGIGSIRGRLGYTFDNTLVFATLGGAVGRVGLDTPTGSETRSVNGGVIGLGVEHAINDGFSVRGDLEHYRFGNREFGSGDVTDTVRTRANLARVSAVFRF